MNHVVGSAVRIRSEISETSGSTVTLKSLVNPSGSTILSDQAMSFNDSDNTSIASVIFQSVTSSPAGKYKFITKVVNASIISLAKGYFYLEEQ